MNYIILDMEWNQAAYAEGLIRTPFCLYGEIIRIGAVKADASFTMVDTFQASIKPKFYKKMNSNVKRLTHINNNDLKTGAPFALAIEDFRRWCGEDFIFLIWGDNDVDMLRDNLKIHGMDDDWVPIYYNVQKIFDMQLTKERRAFGLSRALEYLQEEGLPYHDAFNDALDTYKVMRHLDMAAGIRALEEVGASSYFVAGEGFDKEKVCAGSAEMKSDPELQTLVCKECGAELTCGKWVSQCAGKVIAIGTCENDHGWFFRLNYSKNEDGSRRVRRMIYPLTEEKAATYEKHKAIAKEYAGRQRRRRRRRKANK